MPALAGIARAFHDPVGAHPVKDALDAPDRRRFVERAELLRHIRHDRVIAIQRVGRHRDDHVACAEAVVFRRLDRAEDIANAADAEQALKLFDQRRIDAVALDQHRASGRFGQHLQALLAFHVVDAHQRVHIEDVVNPGDMLVADALNVVRAVAVVVERRALGRLQTDDFVIRPDLLEPIPGGDRPGAAHRRDEGGDFAVADAALLQAPPPVRRWCCR